MNKLKKKHCIDAIKLDKSKVYDWVEWYFLQKLMFLWTFFAHVGG